MGDGKHGGGPKSAISDVVRTISPAEAARTISLPQLELARLARSYIPTGTVPGPADESGEEDGGDERYRRVRELGRGGMGRVDEVFDALLGRAVARKHPHYDASDPKAALLVAEAQVCAQLEHPAIVPVYDLDTAPSGEPFYTMRLTRGRTLRDVLHDNRTANKEHKSLGQLLGVLRQVCLAVDYAHSRGVVHRDLKPDNVVVGEFGEVYVLDWGIAHVMGGSDIRRAALREYVAGSPGYMAPEQAAGKSVDGRADVFALGAILHEILTGEPLEAPLLRETAMPGAPTPPRGIPGTAGAFDGLLAAALELDPARRLASARLMADAIDVFLDTERERAEREADADRCAREGDEASGAFTALAEESTRLRRDAEAALAEIPRWAGSERKDAHWQEIAKSRLLAAEAARALARAEATFMRAVARVERHAAARRGLAALYFRQFLDAEASGEPERMAQYLDLARAYDDGELALELADEGELVVESSAALRVQIARYDHNGLLLELGLPEPLGEAPTRARLLDVGSYVVVDEGRTIAYPILVKRACQHRLVLRARSELPTEVVLIPGGPFVVGGSTERLPDFAIGRLPVTLREYAAFLDELDPGTRERRLPRSGGLVVLQRSARGWELASNAIEGEGRARVSGRELELPIHGVSWYDALAYVTWLAETTGLPYRLPTELEWDKAMRGADGRALPMGNTIDPSFAKFRESRPEASQPEPVGAFPLDASPYGVRDLAGGVGDWTATMVDGRTRPQARRRGLRGRLAASRLARRHLEQHRDPRPHALHPDAPSSRDLGRLSGCAHPRRPFERARHRADGARARLSGSRGHLSALLRRAGAGRVVAMSRSPLALLAAPALAFAALGCEDVSRFSTTGAEAYCGAVVVGSEFREGLSPRVVMSVTLDASHFDGPDSPGALTTSEPSDEGGPEVHLFDAAPLRIIAPLRHDPLSQLIFGDGRDKNAIFAVSPNDPKEGSMLAVVSLMHDDTIQVRLLRPGSVGGSSDQDQVYGLFSLVREPAGCGF